MSNSINEMESISSVRMVFSSKEFDKATLIEDIKASASLYDVWHNLRAANGIRTTVTTYLAKRNLLVAGNISEELSSDRNIKVVVTSVPRTNPDTNKFELVSGVAIAMPVYKIELETFSLQSLPIPTGYELIFLSTLKKNDFLQIHKGWEGTSPSKRDSYLGMQLLLKGTELSKTIKYRLTIADDFSKCYLNTSRLKPRDGSKNNALRFAIVDGILDAIALAKEPSLSNCNILSSLGTNNFTKVSAALASIFTKTDIILVGDYDEDFSNPKKGNPAKFTANLAAKRVPSIRGIYLPKEHVCQLLKCKDYSDFMIKKEPNILDTHYTYTSITETYREKQINKEISSSCRITFNVPENNSLKGMDLLKKFLEEIIDEDSKYTSSIVTVLLNTFDNPTFKNEEKIKSIKEFLKDFYNRAYEAARGLKLELPKYDNEVETLLLESLTVHSDNQLQVYGNKLLVDVPKVVTECELDYEYLNQKELMKADLTNSIVILLGGTGSGKSTLARNLLAREVKKESCNSGIVVTASTSNKTHQLNALNRLVNGNVIEVSEGETIVTLLNTIKKEAFPTPKIFTKMVSKDTYLTDIIVKKVQQRNAKESAKRFKNASRINKTFAFCPPSLGRFMEVIGKNYILEEKKRMHLLVDDIEQVFSSYACLGYPLIRTGINTGRYAANDQLSDLMQISRTVFATAAYLSEEALRWFLRLTVEGTKIIICKLEDNANKKTFKCYEKQEDLISQLLQEANAIQPLSDYSGKAIAVCVDTKGLAENIKNLLISKTNISPKEIIIIQNNEGEFAQSLQGDYFYRNINELTTRAKVLITTSKLKEGVSIENNHFNKVFAIGSSKRILTAEDFYQMASRFRGAEDIYMYMYQSKTAIPEMESLCSSILSRVYQNEDEMEVAIEKKQMDSMLEGRVPQKGFRFLPDLAYSILVYEVALIFRKKYPYRFLEMIKNCTKDFEIIYLEENFSSVATSDLEKVVETINNNPKSYHPSDISNLLSKDVLTTEIEMKAVLDTASGKGKLKAFILDHPEISIPEDIQREINTEYTVEDYIAYRGVTFSRNHLSILDAILNKEISKVKTLIDMDKIEREFYRTPTIVKSYQLLPFLAEIMVNEDLLSNTATHSIRAVDIRSYIDFSKNYLNSKTKVPVFNSDKELLVSAQRILRSIGFNCKFSTEDKLEFSLSDRIQKRLYFYNWVRKALFNLSLDAKEEEEKDKLTATAPRVTYLAALANKVTKSKKEVGNNAFKLAVISSFNS